jgi:DNA-binding transcriptional MerR regulator
MARPKNIILVLELERDAHRLRNKGLSIRKIAEALTQKVGTKINPQSVQRYFDSFKEKPEVKEIEVQVPTPEAQVALEIIQERVTTLKEVDEKIQKLDRVVEFAEKAGDHHLLIKAAKEQVRYYDLKAKLTGDIGPNRAASAPQNNIMIYIPDNGRDK